MYYRNLLKILVSSGISQILPILLSPIIARLYDPYSFGEFGVFMFIYSLLLVFSTGRLNTAINIAKNEEHSNNLFLASVLIMVCFLTLLSITIIFFPGVIKQFISSDSIYLAIGLVILTFLSGSQEILLALYNRNGFFNEISISKLIYSISSVLTQILLGFYNFGVKGLVIGLIIGKFCTVTYFSLTKRIIYPILNKIDFVTIKSSIQRYKKFIIFDIPSALIAVALQQAPNYLFKVLYTAGFAGNYFFIQRLLQAPVTLISGSVLEVFKNEALNEIKTTGRFSNSYLKTIRILGLIIISPMLIGYFYIEEIVVLIYGEEWIIAGEIAKILLPALTLRLLANPLSFAFYLKEKQILNLFILAATLSILIITFHVGLEPINVVRWISVILSFQYLFYIFYSFLLSKKLT